MGLRVIIPVKPFAEAKQRLAPALNSSSRELLAARMFRHVFGIAQLRFGAANVLVISRSQDVLAISRDDDGVGVQENAPSDLNSALSQAVPVAAVSTILVVASDLLLLGQHDLTELARHECAIAPDRQE